MRYPFDHQHGQASIELAVAKTPDGPWTKLDSNPVITPGQCVEPLDGFLVDAVLWKDDAGFSLS